MTIKNTKNIRQRLRHLQQQLRFQVLFLGRARQMAVDEDGGVQALKMHLRIVYMKQIEPLMRHMRLPHRQPERMPQRILLLIIHLIHLHVVKRRLDHWLWKVRGHHEVVGEAIGAGIYGKVIRVNMTRCGRDVLSTESSGVFFNMFWLFIVFILIIFSFII